MLRLETLGQIPAPEYMLGGAGRQPSQFLEDHPSHVVRRVPVEAYGLIRVHAPHLAQASHPGDLYKEPTVGGRRDPSEGSLRRFGVPCHVDIENMRVFIRGCAPQLVDGVRVQVSVHPK